MGSITRGNPEPCPDENILDCNRRTNNATVCENRRSTYGLAAVSRPHITTKIERGHIPRA